MKVVEIKPRKLKGTIHVPSSKSYAHRALLAALLADGISTVYDVTLCDDVMATLRAIEALGAKVEYIVDKRPDLFTLNITGSTPLNVTDKIIDCRQSATTLRFFIPLVLTTNESFVFTAQGNLPSRPLDDMYEILKQDYIVYKNKDGKLPLHLKGLLRGGTYYMDTSITSQTISAMLFTLPLLESDSKIKLTQKLSSKNYVDMTLSMLKHCGIHIDCLSEAGEFFIPGKQQYQPFDYRLEGDYSSAAFWLCACAMGSEVLSTGLKVKSLQADRVFLNILSRMGAKIIKQGNGLKVRAEEPLKEVTIDVDGAPDLVPVLAVLAASLEGITQLTGLRRLQYKETDRVKTTMNMISSLGGDIVQMSDKLIIRGTGSLQGGTVHTGGDHRIAMAGAIASTICKDNVVVTYANYVDKSYPMFWDDFQKVGGEIEEYYMDG